MHRDRLVGLEQDLHDIAVRQGTNVNQIVDLVNENESLLSAMKSNLRQVFVTSMAKVVMRSDTDGDMKIDLKEVSLLSLRLQIQLSPYGIKLDTAKFEAMVREDNGASFFFFARSPAAPVRVRDIIRLLILLLALRPGTQKKTSRP